MLKSICKVINASTRLIVGNTNPALTERTHTLDEIMAERHDLKKEGKLDLAQEADLVARIDKAMGRPERPLPAKQATAVASMEADVEDEEVAPETASIANEILAILKDTTRNIAKRATAIRTLLEQHIALNGTNEEATALLAIKKDVKFLNAVAMNYAKHTH